MIALDVLMFQTSSVIPSVPKICVTFPSHPESCAESRVMAVEKICVRSSATGPHWVCYHSWRRAQLTNSWHTFPNKRACVVSHSWPSCASSLSCCSCDWANVSFQQTASPLPPFRGAEKAPLTKPGKEIHPSFQRRLSTAASSWQTCVLSRDGV